MGKIKVLFLAANPSGTQALKLDEEIRQITAKIRASEYRDSLELLSRWAVRPDDVLQALLEIKPHVVHFSGHGNTAEELILLDDQGKIKPVSKEALVHLFRTLKDNVRVILFNVCSTKPQAIALSEVIDCVIGMNQPIGDQAAILFAASFYRALGFGRSVKEAFELGKTSLLLEGIKEQDTPEMMIRDGQDPSLMSLLIEDSNTGAASSEPATRSSIDPKARQTLLRKLRGLSPGDWASLVSEIPGAANQISRNATLPEQVAELVRWAESSTGPGLEVVEESLSGF